VTRHRKTTGTFDSLTDNNNGGNTMDGHANWDRHLGLTYSPPTPHGDGIDFSATGADGSSYRFHLEMNALKALGAEAFYDADVLDRFEAHQADIQRVAGSLVMLQVRADPIRLKAAHFTDSPWRRSMR
jgi:hypothetical protein